MSDITNTDVTEEIIDETGTDDVPVVLPIELIVEDGSGLAEANCYVDLEFADKFHQQRNNTKWLEQDENVRKGYLVQATEYIDARFKWLGRQMYGDQALKFPRVGIVIDGFEVPPIPVQLKKAVCESALVALSKNSDLWNTKVDIVASEHGAIKRQKVDALEVEYFEKKEEEDSEFLSIYRNLNYYLRGLYKEKVKNTSNVGSIWGYL